MCWVGPNRVEVMKRSEIENVFPLRPLLFFLGTCKLGVLLPHRTQGRLFWKEILTFQSWETKCGKSGVTTEIVNNSCCKHRSSHITLAKVRVPLKGKTSRRSLPPNPEQSKLSWSVVTTSHCWGRASQGTGHWKDIYARHFQREGKGNHDFQMISDSFCSLKYKIYWNNFYSFTQHICSVSLACAMVVGTPLQHGVRNLCQSFS